MERGDDTPECWFDDDMPLTGKQACRNDDMGWGV